MFDKLGFFVQKEICSKSKYQIDIWTSYNLIANNNEYIIFHKRRFYKITTNKLQKGMALITESKDINFNLNEDFLVYWLVYYQRNLKSAHIKWWHIEELELYKDLFKSFWLELKLRKYLEIRWNYPSIETISQFIKHINLDQAISFLLGMSIIYGNWNIIEEQDNIYLWNILIKAPFDSILSEFQQIIFSIEDILIKNKIYNKLTYTKKWYFIWNINDYDLLKIFWQIILHSKLKNIFQLDKKLEVIFSKQLPILSKQLFNDLRINLNNFKLTEIQWINLFI